MKYDHLTAVHRRNPAYVPAKNFEEARNNTIGAGRNKQQHIEETYRNRTPGGVQNANVLPKHMRTFGHRLFGRLKGIV